MVNRIKSFVSLLIVAAMICVASISVMAEGDYTTGTVLEVTTDAMGNSIVTIVTREGAVHIYEIASGIFLVDEEVNFYIDQSGKIHKTSNGTNDTNIASNFSNENLLYTDVPANNEYYDAITTLSENGIINGYGDGTFEPYQNVNRAEFATILCRALGIYGDASITVFTDVPEMHWATGYITAAYTLGIINGMGDGTFAPESPVTYEQAVKMVVSAFEGGREYAEAEGGYPYGYLDVAGEWELLYNVNGIVGTPANRGMVAQIIYNAFFVDAVDAEDVSNNTDVGRNSPNTVDSSDDDDILREDDDYFDEIVDDKGGSSEDYNDFEDTSEKE